MKQHKQTIKGFFSGLLTAALILALAVPAMAAMKDIKVSVGGISIYVDGQLKVPVNAQGTPVDPLVYDGTTYLPVRAISNMLGKEVTWDGDTSSIYIGEVPDRGGRSVPAEELEKFSGNSRVWTGSDAKYSILGDEYAPFNAIQFVTILKSGIRGHNFWGLNNDDITWKLASDYQSIDGKFVVAYDKLGTNAEFEISFYSINQYGEETLIKSFTNKCGDGVIDFHVNVTGCDFVKVTSKLLESGNARATLYDITATTAD